MRKEKRAKEREGEGERKKEREKVSEKKGFERYLNISCVS